MSSVTLSETQLRRLERLAHAAGRTPKAMLRFVLRDGFELCEMEVREALAAEQVAGNNGYISHAAAQSVISGAIANAGKVRKAA